MSKPDITGLVFATLLEAHPFIRGLNLRTLENSPFAVYGNDGLSLIVSGMGKAGAAMACTYLIQRYPISRICNLGAAGATLSEYSLGECFPISKVIELDRFHLKTGMCYEYQPQTLDNLPGAVLATQDRAVITVDQRERAARHAQLVDMEGASIIQACNLFHMRCFLFKFVSDTPDHVRAGSIEENIKHYRDALYGFFRDVVVPRLGV